MEAITNPQTVILFLASAATFITVIAIGLPYLERDPLSSRLKAVAKRREELSLQLQQRSQKKRPMLRDAHVGAMKAVLERLKMQNLMGSPALRIKMSQAGFRGQSPAITFAFTRLLMPPVFAIVAAIVLFAGSKFEMGANLKIVIVLGAGVVGFYLPNVILQNIIQKRQQLLTKSFPDALDLLVICVEAGLSVEAAFSRVAEEMAENGAIIAEEFGLTTAELAFLGDRRQALENLALRTGVTGVKSLATALIQAERYGTPLAVALRVLAQESRDHRLSKAEEKAASLPAKLTVPMIVFFLPVIFFVVLGPAVIQVVHTF
ncbi:MAG: type II secretion system F family protein [Alphaproteobacteria bacterium]